MTTYFPELKVRSRWNAAVERWWRHRDDLMAVLNEQIAATRADPGLADREDILALLVRTRDEDGRGLGDDDLRDELVALIAAGHEQPGGRDHLDVLLADDGAVRDRAAQAARDGDDGYLDALVKEVLRIRPPLPGTAARILAEPFAMGRHTIPPGTAILVDGLRQRPRPVPRARRAATPSLPRRRTRAVHLAALRRRRAPLHRRGARRARDQGRAQHDAAARPTWAGHARPGARGAPRPDNGPARGRARAGRRRGGRRGQAPVAVGTP